MEDDSHNKFKIMGRFGVIVQGLLGLFAFLVLVLKRHFEKPKR